jgi:hypothetical protein
MANTNYPIVRSVVGNDARCSCFVPSDAAVLILRRIPPDNLHVNMHDCLASSCRTVGIPLHAVAHVGRTLTLNVHQRGSNTPFYETAVISIAGI